MSKRSLPRLDILLLPFRGGDNDGNEGNEGGQNNNEGNRKEGGQGNAAGANSHEDDDDDDDLDGITDPNQRRIAELSRESGKHRRERNAARRERDALQAEMDRLKNSGGTEKEQWAAEKKLLEKQIEDMTSNTSNAIIRTAVQSPDSKYSWYDVPVVMGLLDREALEIDLEEGSVEGLDAELKRIAKEKPYLVKKGPAGGGSNNNGNGNNGGGNGGTSPSGSTGSNPNNRNSSNDAKAARRAELEANYPSLNF